MYYKLIRMLRSGIIYISIFIVSYMCGKLPSRAHGKEERAMYAAGLRIEQDKEAGTISVFRSDGKEPILVQNAKKEARPYIHPIVAPDGKGSLTEYRPKHHLHQTGLYWGLKEVNGRDFFMKWQGDYWRRVSADVVDGEGQEVKWQTVYDMLDENGETVLTETQNWSMQEKNGKYVLDLEWKGRRKRMSRSGSSMSGGCFFVCHGTRE